MRNMVYYIGAGLPKALEAPGKPIPLMYDFIKVMADYLDDDVILTTLAELVNARVFSSKSDDTETLAKTLVGRNADRSPDNRAAFRRALKALPPESIEVLLERASKSDNISAGSSDARFRYAINRVFYLIDANINPLALRRFLTRQFTQPNTQHTFVNFDYDLILDRELERFERLWAPQSGYGFDIPFYSIRESIGARAEDTAVHDAEPFVGQLPSSVLLLKPHGSLNWLLPYRSDGRGLRRFEDNPLILPLTDEGKLRYIASTATFQQVSFQDRQRISDVQPLIISPTYDKLTDLGFLMNIRSTADHALHEADEIYVIGWSMPATDIDHQARIANVMKERNKRLAKLVLVSYGMSHWDVVRIEKTFAMPWVELHNDGFAAFVDKTIP
jgi:hypothetical protein